MKYNLLVLIFVFTVVLATGNPAFAGNKLPDTQYFPASGKTSNVALIMLGGSEGGLPNYYDTERLTQRGYHCLLVGYFGTENTPDRLELIPLESTERVIQEFRSRPEIQNRKIIVWGGSKGGELALLLASRDQGISGVIATVPSAVVFQGIGGRPVSSWTSCGEPVPFVPYIDYDWSTIVNLEYEEAYRLSLEQTDAVEKAGIRVENINGPILLLTAKSDTMWPSALMGDMIVERLKEKAFPHPFQHFSYENAGHTLNENYMMGGTEDGNRHARIDSGQRIIAFLEQFEDQEKKK